MLPNLPSFRIAAVYNLKSKTNLLCVDNCLVSFPNTVDFGALKSKNDAGQICNFHAGHFLSCASSEKVATGQSLASLLLRLAYIWGMSLPRAASSGNASLIATFSSFYLFRFLTSENTHIVSDLVTYVRRYHLSAGRYYNGD